MSSNTRTWIARVETIKVLWARGLAYTVHGLQAALSVTQGAAVCGLWRYISDGPLPSTFYSTK